VREENFGLASTMRGRSKRKEGGLIAERDLQARDLLAIDKRVILRPMW